MRYVIVGAGAVGGTIGGLLHKAGMDVAFVARGEHGRVMARDGLRLKTPTSDDTLKIPVIAEVSDWERGDDDVLVFATKTQDTLALLEQFPSDLPVVCAQNGVEAERMALRRYDEVYGVCVMLPATRLDPGVVIASGSPYPGMLDIGRYPTGTDDRSAAIAADLRRAGFLSTDDPTVMRWKYAKLLRNVGNAIQALAGAIEDDAARELFRRTRREAETVYAAAGIDWTRDDEWVARRGRNVEVVDVDGAGRGGGSSWQSLMRGAGTIEADYLNGEIALLARLYGVPAPVNAFLQRAAVAAARDGAKPGDVSATELLERLDAA